MRVRGIEIRVDGSVAAIFLLIVVHLGGNVLPLQHPDWPWALRWLLALATAAAFFASVLAHEMAHALVARAHDVPVDGITLFAFGGVARIPDEPPSARIEFLIAVAGPVTSAIIGVVAVVAGGILVGPVATLLAWFGSVNLLLGLFNLLPGFPLDGGRVLRAALWRATGDFQRATHWAALGGRLVALVLVFAGLAMAMGMSMPLLGRGLIPGLWLIFVGWFLYAAATRASAAGRTETGALPGPPTPGPRPSSARSTP